MHELQELEQKKRELQMKDHGARRRKAAAVPVVDALQEPCCMMHLITVLGLSLPRQFHQICGSNWTALY